MLSSPAATGHGADTKQGGSAGQTMCAHPGVAHDCSSDRNALLLPAAELDAALAHARGVALGQSLDKAVRIGSACGHLHVLCARARRPQPDVLCNGQVEEHLQAAWKREPRQLSGACPRQGPACRYGQRPVLLVIMAACRTKGRPRTGSWLTSPI